MAKAAPQGKGSVLATTAVQTQGKGSVFSRDGSASTRQKAASHQKPQQARRYRRRSECSIRRLRATRTLQVSTPAQTKHPGGWYRNVDFHDGVWGGDATQRGAESSGGARCGPICWFVVLGSGEERGEEEKREERREERRIEEKREEERRPDCWLVVSGGEHLGPPRRTSTPAKRSPRGPQINIPPGDPNSTYRPGGALYELVCLEF